MVQSIPSVDPPERSVDFRPERSVPYDPRHMLAGTNGPDGRWLSGFFDRGEVFDAVDERERGTVWCSTRWKHGWVLRGWQPVLKMLLDNNPTT